MDNRNAPVSARSVTDRSNMFHPEDMYSDQPRPTILSKASNKKTEKYFTFNKLLFFFKQLYQIRNRK